MSRRSIRALIVLAAVVAALALALVLILVIPRMSGKEADGNTVICSLSDIDRLTFNHDEDVYTFEKRNGTWVYTGREDWPVSQSRLDRLATALQGMTASRVFKDGEALSGYGLDPAKYTLTACENEKTVTLRFGDSCGDADVYAVSTETEGICVVSNTVSSYYLGYDILQMLDAGSSPGVTEADQAGLTLTLGGRSVCFRQENDHWYLVAGSGEKFLEDDLSAVGPDGETHTLRKYLNDMGQALSSYRTSTLAGYGCSEEELASFGLDDPLTAVFTAADGTETIYLFGAETADDGGTARSYLALPDSPAVYLAGDASPLYLLLELFGE